MYIHILYTWNNFWGFVNGFAVISIQVKMNLKKWVFPNFFQGVYKHIFTTTIGWICHKLPSSDCISSLLPEVYISMLNIIFWIQWTVATVVQKVNYPKNILCQNALKFGPMFHVVSVTFSCANFS